MPATNGSWEALAIVSSSIVFALVGAGWTCWVRSWCLNDGTCRAVNESAAWPAIQCSFVNVVPLVSDLLYHNASDQDNLAGLTRGMCGVGDLMLSCSSMQSRNYSLGVELGEGASIEDILKSRTSVTEGVHTAKAALALAKRHAVDMPITEAVNKTLNEGMTIEEAIEEMLNRPFKYEMSKKH